MWAAINRNVDYIRLHGLKELVDGDIYRKEFVACGLHDYVVSG